jgi:hypothetical protein|nr:MAG TPA: hypothetical protein [Siphoviridae sp. ctTYz13]
MKTTGIQIGKVIYKLLDTNELNDKLKNKKYPLIADTTTTFPFIIYRRSNVFSLKNKDISNESVTVEILIISDKYKEGIEIAELVRSAIEGKNGVIEGIEIEDIIMEDAYEEYVDDSFIQILNFRIILN